MTAQDREDFHLTDLILELAFLFTSHQESYQVDPGGADENYECVDENEVDLRENKEKGMDDGDRLVGGKISSTRFSRK